MLQSIITKHSENLSRIINMQGSDPGFFLLATHSFIESFLREKYQLFGDEYRFPDLIFQFRQELIDHADDYIKNLDVLNVLNSKQVTANAVRHRFNRVDSEEAATAAYRLIQFCRLAGHNCPAELKKLEDSLNIWTERSCNWERFNELKNLKWELFQTNRKNKEILEELDEFKQHQIENDHFNAQIRILEIEIEELKSRNEDKDSRVDELRKQKHELQCEKKNNEKRIAELESVSTYIGNLSRISNYTRTRFDYERDITRLTKEQQRILDSISLQNDFLVKGGAGTGKTLVLIKALQKALSESAAELDFGGEIRVKLLTYNKTLVKYDRYLAELMKNEAQVDLIDTADKYIYDKLQKINTSYRIDYGKNLEVMAKEYNTTDFFSENELFNEIENFLFSRDITKEEYIDERIPRKGLKHPLTAAQRKVIWGIRDQLVKYMQDELTFSKNYSRRVILDYISEHPEDDSVKDTDFIFIDEVQDLSAADIKVIKACTKRALIMAGDSDQSIYQPGFTFSRGDVDIRGTSKILRTNFRNTVEIHELAEKYRVCSEHIDKDTQPEAFRIGPPPEIYLGGDKNELISLIIKKAKLFIEELHYDPENISILVPTGKDVDLMHEALVAADIESRNLKDDDFSFDMRDSIRISTMHSSKGLDFPIVLLFLYKEPFTGFFYDDNTRHKMTRNLIYVSMTRAMDHLNIFALDKENKPTINDLVKLMREPE